VEAFKNFQRAWKLAMPYCEYEPLGFSNLAGGKLNSPILIPWCNPTDANKSLRCPVAKEHHPNTHNYRGKPNQ
jgi:hypothetical protein